MKHLRAHTGKLEIIERLKNSVNGNPRYLVMVGGLVCRTRPDASYNYDIQNLDGRTVRVEIGTYYGRATIASIQGVKACN